MKISSWKIEIKKAYVIMKNHATGQLARGDFRTTEATASFCEDDCGGDRCTHAPAHRRRGTCTRTNTNSTRAHAHTTHGTGRSAGATPRRPTRRGRPTPTAAAVQRTEAGAGARRPGLARANHLGPNNTSTLPTRLPHISVGEQEFEEWEAGEVGGSQNGPGAARV